MPCEWVRKRSRASRRHSWIAGMALMAATGANSCKNNDERLEFICSRVGECGQLRSRAECEARLDDALADGRTTDGSAASCAVCVDPRNSCDSLLVTRDCDTACEGVDLITDMYTRDADRADACGSADKFCYVSNPTANAACTSALKQQISANAKLDKLLASCVNCMKSAASQATGVARAASICNANTCSAECSQFQGVRERLLDDLRIRTICDYVTLNCRKAGGYTGNLDDCAAAGITQTTSVLTRCAQCLTDHPDCGLVFPGDASDGGEAGASAKSGLCDLVCADLPGFAPAYHVK